MVGAGQNLYVAFGLIAISIFNLVTRLNFCKFYWRVVICSRPKQSEVRKWICILLAVGERFFVVAVVMVVV